MVGEVGGEEEGEKEASGRREGNTMGDGEDMFAFCDRALYVLDDEMRTRKHQGPQKPHRRPVQLPTEKQEANRSPASTCSSNSSSCFTQGEQVHIHVHVTTKEVAGFSGDDLNATGS